MPEVAKVKSMTGGSSSNLRSHAAPVKIQTSSSGAASMNNILDVESCCNSRQSMAIHHLVGRAFGNSFRHLLLCSGPGCFNQVTDDEEDEDDDRFISHPDPFEETLKEKEVRGQDWRLRLELQAVLCHLEVRWQLFSEALAKFGDLEAMLAVCTDQVRWRRCGKMGPCKDAHLSDDLQSLISRKLSMAVRTERITHLLPSGDLGSSLDREGNWGPEHEMSMDRARAEMALNLLREKGGDVGDEFAIRLRITLLCVVEENTYTIRDQKGEIVEEGKQVVVWEQHNPTWYIRGCVSYPFNN
ncbi:hypothetical protein BDL97_01G155200 [Sphagnum fallax]|nr:hypothetical protein BDL97_01G155200 [Sphagnum fallax]